MIGKGRKDGRKLQNGSDHRVVASYSGLYEGDVEHINVFGLVF